MKGTAVLAAAFAATLFAADTAPSASSVMDTARNTAAAQHKTVFLIFHASWWGWCKRLDKFIETPEIKPIIDKYFVQARVDVQEQKEKKDLNTPGGDELMDKVGGKDAGLPFIAFVDDKGETIVNGMYPGDDKHKKGNIGHPMEPHEVDWFMTMLQKAVPSMTADETKTIENYLRTQKK